MILNRPHSNRSGLASQSFRDFAKAHGRRPPITPGLAHVGRALSGQFGGLAEQLASAPNAAARSLVMQRGISLAAGSPDALRSLNQLKANDIKSAFAYVGGSASPKHAHLAIIAITVLAAVAGIPVPDAGMHALMGNMEQTVFSPEVLEEMENAARIAGPVVIKKVVERTILAEALAALAAAVAAVLALPSELAIGVIVVVGIIAVMGVRYLLGY